MQANSGKFQLSDEPRRAKIPRDLNLAGELSQWRARIENSRGVPPEESFWHLHDNGGGRRALLLPGGEAHRSKRSDKLPIPGPCGGPHHRGHLAHTSRSEHALEELRFRAKGIILSSSLVRENSEKVEIKSQLKIRPRLLAGSANEWNLHGFLQYAGRLAIPDRSLRAYRNRRL